MQVTKIAFSDEEMQAMLNSKIFEVKQQAINKVYEIFAELESALKLDKRLVDLPYENLEKKTGKIFRGESYKNLPYVVLDFPKLFSADNVFTFRSMFWWSNEFSFTLHLQGHALDKYKPALRNNIKQLLNHGFYFCINNSPWQYSFTPDNYIPLEGLMHDANEFQRQLERKEFIKLSRRIAINEYENAVDYGKETFQLLMNSITNR